MDGSDVGDGGVDGGPGVNFFQAASSRPADRLAVCISNAKRWAPMTVRFSHQGLGNADKSSLFGANVVPASLRHRIAGNLRVLVEIAGMRGVSPLACLEGTGITPQQLDAADAEVEPEHDLRAARNVVAILGADPVLGLEVGRRVHFTAFGALGLAIVSSPTVRRAHELGVRFLNLTSSFLEFAIEEADDELRLVIEEAKLPSDLRSFFVTRAAAIIVNLQREALGVRVRPRRVTFTMPEPVSSMVFAETLDAAPAFGAARNVLAVDATILDQPLPYADVSTALAAEEAYRRLLGMRERGTSLTARVRELLFSKPTRAGDMEAVASALGMTSRTLRRRLLEEGTTFRELGDEVRAKLAEELLNEHVSVAMIAARLGYADASSFINAFKRWNGRPPGALRSARRRTT